VDNIFTQFSKFIFDMFPVCFSQGIIGAAVLYRTDNLPRLGLSKNINIFKYIQIISEYYNTIWCGRIFHPSAYRVLQYNMIQLKYNTGVVFNHIIWGPTMRHFGCSSASTVRRAFLSVCKCLPVIRPTANAWIPCFISIYS
jgi:hypothetical protein